MIKAIWLDIKVKDTLLYDQTSAFHLNLVEQDDRAPK